MLGGGPEPGMCRVSRRKGLVEENRWMPRWVPAQGASSAGDPGSPAAGMGSDGAPALAVTCCALQSSGCRWRSTRTRWNSS